ncbi:MAG: LamG-like jellyroll fold domain-containing protein, partial [Nannocystaceae bacterium]
GTAGAELGEGSSTSVGEPTTRGASSTSGADGTTTNAATTGSTTAIDPSTSGSSSDDGTTGEPQIIDDGLLARWWIDEAEMGQTRLLLADAVLPPLSLSVLYVNQWPTFTELEGSRGLYWGMSGRSGRALAPIAGSKIDLQLNGRTTATFELVVAVQDVVSETSRLFHIGTGSATDLAIGSEALDRLEVRWTGGTRLQFDTSLTGSIQIIHVVVDTDQATATDRVRAYVDGNPLTRNNETTVAEGAGLPLQPTSSLVLGNRADGQRSIAGSLHYAAIYLEAFDASQVMANAQVLKASDDRD